MRTYISDSLISEALIMIREMKQNNCFAISEIENIKTYYGINKEKAINLVSQFNWVVKDAFSYEITPYGESLLKEFDGTQLRANLYRNILRNYITTCKPIWSKRIPYGRNEAYRIMSDEEQICFKKAGLMNTPVSREEVDWWDELAELERQAIQTEKDETGRKGEELTIKYEKSRTNADPLWESVDSNLAGYDILSQVSETDTRKILIEVKSTTSDIENGCFYISHNEWNFATAGYNQKRYFFYLWLLGKTSQLAIIPYSEMVCHIPEDNGMGEWNDVEIPFSAFSKEFHSIT